MDRERQRLLLTELQLQHPLTPHCQAEPEFVERLPRPDRQRLVLVRRTRLLRHVLQEQRQLTLPTPHDYEEEQVVAFSLERPWPDREHRPHAPEEIR